MTRQMHLGVFTYPGGHHIAGWRHSSVVPGDILGYDYYRRTAEAAERGKFDLVFVGDMLAAREKDGRVIAQGALNNIDSISILSAVAGATRNISASSASLMCVGFQPSSSSYKSVTTGCREWVLKGSGVIKRKASAVITTRTSHSRLVRRLANSAAL